MLQNDNFNPKKHATLEKFINGGRKIQKVFPWKKFFFDVMHLFSLHSHKNSVDHANRIIIMITSWKFSLKNSSTKYNILIIIYESII